MRSTNRDLRRSLFMKAKIGILVITLLIFILSAAACSIPDKYPGQIGSQYWVSDDVQMFFGFPAESGAGKAVGVIIIDNAYCRDLLLEWSGKDGVVNVKDCSYNLLFVADTVTNEKEQNCTFTIKSDRSGWKLPETIIFKLTPKIPYKLINRDPVPEQTTLDFWILQEVDSQDWSGYTEIPGWMGAREYYGKLYRPSIDENGDIIYPEECVKYLISAWPDYADGGQYVTRITITDPNVQFFGLTVESTREQFDEVLTKNGLKHETRVDELDQAAEYKESWSNMSYSITLTKRNGKCLVVIDAPVSNRDNIVF